MKIIILIAILLINVITVNSQSVVNLLKNNSILNFKFLAGLDIKLSKMFLLSTFDK